MSSPWIHIYEVELERRLHSNGLKRESPGVYARTGGQGVWEGLWLVFTQEAERVRVAPNLGLFCPLASELEFDGFKELYGASTHRKYAKLGRAIVSAPLYSLVNKERDWRRHSFSYDVGSESEIVPAAKNICEDFSQVCTRFFEETTTMEKLRDRILLHPSDPSAAIDAMVLSYLIDPAVSLNELDRYASLSNNIMTKDFAMYFKTRLIGERSSK